MADAPQTVLEMRHITKRFPGIVANDDVSFDLRLSEVHALLGENGAGKSTLMNILYGLYHPDEGEIEISGKPVRLGTPSAAIDAGVGMVHQHFMLIPVMTVAENIVLAEEPTHAGGFLDLREANRRVSEISERFGLAVDPKATVQDISVGQQQRVEILKALYRNANILVLDEPTAVLTPQEAKELFQIIRGLTEQGKSIIFISHKLNEVTEVADRITVLRRGKLIETLPAAGATEESLARLMVGREVLLRVEKGEATPAETLLEVDGLHVFDDRGIEKVRGLSFEVRAGEIVGIAGIDGNGQTELIDAMTGLRKVAAGTVAVGGKDVTDASVFGHFEAGLGHIPEDRQRRGLVLEFSIAENIALHDFRKEPDSKFGWLYPAPPRRARGAPDRGVRRARRRAADPRRSPLGRQPAEGRARARDRPRPARAHRRPADPRAGRRCDRVRPSPPDRGARRGARHPARLARARGDPLALRPDPRHLRGRDRRRRSRRPRPRRSSGSR